MNDLFFRPSPYDISVPSTFRVECPLSCTAKARTSAENSCGAIRVSPRHGGCFEPRRGGAGPCTGASCLRYRAILVGAGSRRGLTAVLLEKGRDPAPGPSRSASDAHHRSRFAPQTHDLGIAAGQCLGVTDSVDPHCFEPMSPAARCIADVASRLLRTSGIRKHESRLTPAEFRRCASPVGIQARSNSADQQLMALLASVISYTCLELPIVDPSRNRVRAAGTALRAADQSLGAFACGNPKIGRAHV